LLSPFRQDFLGGFFISFVLFVGLSKPQSVMLALRFADPSLFRGLNFYAFLAAVSGALLSEEGFCSPSSECKISVLSVFAGLVILTG